MEVEEKNAATTNYLWILVVVLSFTWIGFARGLQNHLRYITISLALHHLCKIGEWQNYSCCFTRPSIRYCSIKPVNGSWYTLSPMVTVAVTCLGSMPTKYCVFPLPLVLTAMPSLYGSIETSLFRLISTVRFAPENINLLLVRVNLPWSMALSSSWDSLWALKAPSLQDTPLAILKLGPP